MAFVDAGKVFLEFGNYTLAPPTGYVMDSLVP
jgi:hypothetical protein